MFFSSIFLLFLEQYLWTFLMSICPFVCAPFLAPPTVRIVHSGHACNVEEERYTERVYTIREGETLELTCLVTGHPRPQIRWTKTAGSVSDRFQDSSVFNETLHIAKIQRHQGGRYYCKAENGLGSPAIKSIRVDVYYLDDPVVTVHQSIGEAKEQFYYERTVFLRCVANSNPPVRYSWHRGRDVLSQGSDKGVEIYEPFFTQGETKILKLKNLRPKDYANYSCIASVRNVCGIPDRRVIFRLTNKTASPSIKLLVEDPIVVNPGQTVSLVCIATGGEPPPTLTWTSVLENLPEKSVLKDGTLTLPAISSEDAGVYSCIASNNVGNPAKKSTTIIVRALKKGRFWITPDPYHNDDNIQIGREVKISCQVEATPPEELQFSWLKNGRALRSSERMVITQTDPDISPGTTNLDIIDLKFTDFGTYTCVASLRGGGIPEISIDVNISSTTVPPNLTVPRGKSPLVVREGETVELECLVSGKPKPIILWSRADKEVPMPDGSMQMESYDGVLRIINVSREMSGSYRCQTSQYNGFNVKPREALVELIVQYPPAVEPVSTEVRQGLSRPVPMTCRVLRAHPSRVLRYEWRLGSRMLHAGHFDTSDETEYSVRSLSRDGYGEYTCDITNEAGAGRCTFLVTGKAYAPEFYYDTYSPLWQNRPRVYGYKLQWTQMNPESVDRIMAYRLGIRQIGQQRWWEQEIPVEGPIQKGELITYNLTELIRPEAYEVRLTPITRFGEGDSAIRMVTYSGEFHCSFEEEPICMFTQDKNDNFDWTRHSAATRDTKYTPNTGPSGDRSGSKQGFYMYIETSRPRKEGTLNAFMKQKGQATSDSGPVWSLSGNQGDRWKQAKISIHPTSSFQVIFEGIRGPGIEGDIAIDDVTLEEGECPDPPSNHIRSKASILVTHIWPLCPTLAFTLFQGLR
ncbi:MAM domain-containing glycosylphosphatidylinositol anchor protein 2 [Bagarius yarrelli]|uniref:MAM domain-containing glycosylphosphatidylinositol anchor protein 2 n=1 Tax=Bagarius yarrelli TaxID=175774 RepID=A0A556TT91_BAGYA|nr:MAM domain-containing glycosylphosphatidylinositol anchor protein 2 [Bagarius yarrelli]